jgi:hypothetical protein
LRWGLMNYLAGAGFELQSSWALPPSVARIIGMSHCTWPLFYFLKYITHTYFMLSV